MVEEDDQNLPPPKNYISSDWMPSPAGDQPSEADATGKASNQAHRADNNKTKQGNTYPTLLHLHCIMVCVCARVCFLLLLLLFVCLRGLFFCFCFFYEFLFFCVYLFVCFVC